MSENKSRFIRIMNSRIDKNSIQSYRLSGTYKIYKDDPNRPNAITNERALDCLIVETFDGETFSWDEDMIDVHATLKMLDEEL